MNKETVLVTGASSGIGLEIARQFAKHGHPLILVAPDEDELNAVAHEFTEDHGVDVKVNGQDLEEEYEDETIYDDTKRHGIDVDILVNNAGFGQRGKFWEIPLHRDISMIRVNLEAVVRLTKLFLPDMLERGRGKILNTASV